MKKPEYNIKKVLGKRIREERIKRNLTIEQLSEMVELSPSFLGCVERGERALSLEKLYNMSELFQVTTDSLIKEQLQNNSKVESLFLLLKELDDNEYNSIYEIAKVAKEHLKGK